MAGAASTGNQVSFFYQISAAEFSQSNPLSLLPAHYQLQLIADADIVLGANHALPLTPAAPFVIGNLSNSAVLRIFGANVGWAQLQQILQVLACEAALPGRCFQPHPQLAPALELQLAVLPEPHVLAKLNTLAQAEEFEVVCLTAVPTLSQPGVLVMDMDSTAIQIECIDEIAKLAGTGEQVAAVTARAMNGELDFAQSLLARVATLQGAPETILRQVLDAVPLMPGLTELVQHLQKHQWQVAIASGGFTYFTEALQQRLGLTATFANVLEIVDAKLTGKVLGDIVDANTKAQVVSQLAAEYCLAPTQTVAIGDGANDIPMLNAAALGVAFHAKPKVQAQAKAAIRKGSLLQLLYLLD
ncbi:phosphoserine phosphatase SerB [Rheinheimera sp.]|uniref:phosphoserine phosphatase SerB n=1 Tax=Rheinheimera sp. TaxID=1869214 RepID=UPI004047E39E